MREKEIPPFYMSGAAILEMAAILKNVCSSFEFENVNFGFLGQMNSWTITLASREKAKKSSLFYMPRVDILKIGGHFENWQPF